MLRHHDKISTGPYTLQELVDAAKAGSIAATTEVWHPQTTQGEWVSARRVRPIREAMPAAESVPPVAGSESSGTLPPVPPPVSGSASADVFPGTPIEPSPAILNRPEKWSQVASKDAVSKVAGFRVSAEWARRIRACTYALAGLVISIMITSHMTMFNEVESAVQQTAVSAHITGWVCSVYFLAGCIDRFVTALALKD